MWRRIAQLRAHQPIFDGEDENARTPESLVARPDVEGGMIHKEAVRSLRRAILALPAGYREAVILCELHELSYADAARVLGCAVGTVRSRLHRARTLLSERLAVGKSSSSGCLV